MFFIVYLVLVTKFEFDGSPRKGSFMFLLCDLC